MNNFVLEIGSILKGLSYNYKIEKVLGQGSFGITYLASVKMQGTLGTLDTNIKVAIKEFFMKDRNGRKGDSVTYDGDMTLFENYRRDFVREATNLSRLNHPNIVKVLENFDNNGTSYYAMEFIEGTNLNEYITSQNGLSEYEALSCVSTIAEAVGYMHQNNMLHLDIKPLNVMRGNDGKLTLIDFGLSKQFNSEGEPESSTHIGGGTMGYAPLEQNNYKRGMGFPATLDIYALGATLYKCLTAQTPPEASYVLNEGLPIENLQALSVSDDTIRFIESAMEPIVRRRIKNTDAFNTEIQHILPIANRNKPVIEIRETEVTVIDENQRWQKKDIDSNQKQAIDDFISGMVLMPNGCKVEQINRAFYHIIKKDELSKNIYSVYGILQLIDKLQELTGLHWRLPNHEELVASWRDQSGYGEDYALYFSEQDYSLHKASRFGGTDEEIDVYSFFCDFFFSCSIVLDPMKADFILTQEEYKRQGIEDTIIIVGYKGLWHFGLCPVKTDLYENTGDRMHNWGGD